MTEQAVLKETVVPEVTQEERVCRLAQGRDLYLARALDRYRLLDPKQSCLGVASGTLDEIEVARKDPFGLLNLYNAIGRPPLI